MSKRLEEVEKKGRGETEDKGIRQGTYKGLPLILEEVNSIKPHFYIDFVFTLSEVKDSSTLMGCKILLCSRGGRGPLFLQGCKSYVKKKDRPSGVRNGLDYSPKRRQF